MALVSGYDARPTPIGLALSVIAGICAAGGTLSVIDAADEWQSILNTVHEWQPARSPTCPGQWTVSGWGDGAVLLFGGVALTLIAVTLAGSLFGHQWRARGKATALLTLVPLFLVWLDSYFVSGSPIGDCDGAGISGAASTAVNRGGWLLAAAIFSCFLSWFALEAEQAEPRSE